MNALARLSAGLLAEQGPLHRLAIGAGGGHGFLLARERMRAAVGADAAAIRQMRDTGLLFVHVPKAAGKSIGEALGLRSNHRPARFFRWADPAGFAAAHSFAFVRNPFDRLASAFHYLKAIESPAPDVAWVRANLGDVPDFPRFLERLRDPRFARRIMGWTHFLPQTYFVCDRAGAVIVDDVFFFEDMRAGLATLSDRLGRDVTPRHINASARAPAASYYDGRSTELVARLYAGDFAAFGYDPSRPPG